MKKLFALAGLASVLALPCAALADTNGTQCTTIALDETTVLSCTPVADPEAYYYAGPEVDGMTLSSVPVDESAPNADTLANDAWFVAFAGFGGS